MAPPPRGSIGSPYAKLRYKPASQGREDSALLNVASMLAFWGIAGTVGLFEPSRFFTCLTYVSTGYFRTPSSQLFGAPRYFVALWRVFAVSMSLSGSRGLRDCCHPISANRCSGFATLRSSVSRSGNLKHTHTLR